MNAFTEWQTEKEEGNFNMSKAPPEPGLNTVKGNYPRTWYTTHRSDSVYTARKYADWIVIEIPGGWLSNGDAIMKVGDAKSLAEHAPQLSANIGRWLKKEGALRSKHKLGRWLETPELNIYVAEDLKTLVLPTKPAKIGDSPPYLSWKNPDCHTMVKEGLEEIREEFLLYERYAASVGEPLPRLVLRPPGIHGDYSGLTLRQSMSLMRQAFSVTADKDRTHIPVVIVSKEV